MLANELQEEVIKARNHDEWRLKFMTLAMRDEENRMKGRAEGHLEMLISLVKDGLLKISDAARKAEMSEEEFKKLI